MNQEKQTAQSKIAEVIPGHARAYSLWLAILATITAGLGSGRWEAAMGMAMFVMGTFIGDQATHLAQEDHSAPPPTQIETMLQGYRWTSVVVGTVIALVGLIIAFHQ